MTRTWSYVGEAQELRGAMKYEELEAQVIEWARQRMILRNGNSQTQLLKTVSELGELADAVIKEDREKIADGLGDVLVTLIIVARLEGMDLVDCLAGAYDEIKDRQGYLNDNGVFVKQEKDEEVRFAWTDDYYDKGGK